MTNDFTATKIDGDDHNVLLTREQLLSQVWRYKNYMNMYQDRIRELEQWQSDAFAVYPNIDLDIERLNNDQTT